jgi:hypothetical protein
MLPEGKEKGRCRMNWREMTGIRSSGGKPINASAFGRKSGPASKPVLAVALSLVLAAMLLTIAVPYAKAADPGHAASSISAGTFESGDFAFPSNLTVTKFFIANGTTLYVDAINGRVGIGTITPGALLALGNSDGGGLTMPSLTKLWIEGTGAAQQRARISLGVDANRDYGAYIAASSFGETGNDQVLELGSRGSGADQPAMYLRNGNVGINTTSPGQTLTVLGTANVTGATYLGNSKCPSGQVLTTDATTGLLSCVAASGIDGAVTGTGTDGYIARWNSTSNINNSVIYQNGSNVGIGTTNPGYKLDTRGTLKVGDANSGVLISSNGGTGYASISSYDTTLRLQYGNDASFDVAAFTSTSGSPYFTLFGNDAGAGTTKYLRFNVASDGTSQIEAQSGEKMAFLTGGGTKMTIDNSGNVGIGTTSPISTYKLDVVGDIRVGNTTTDGGSRISLSQTTTGGVINIRNSSADSVITLDARGTNPSSFMAGNVGIGTTAPSNKLDVAGDINASSGSLIFYNEIMPDGATCSNGEILKKTGANDWDCAADSGLTTSYNATYHTDSQVIAGNYSNWANQTANNVECADCVDASDVAANGVGSSELASGAVTAAGTELDSTVAGDGLILSSGALTVNMSVGGGIVTTSDSLSLNRSCGSDQLLKWNSGSSYWYCADDSGLGSESDPRWQGNVTACTSNQKLYFSGSTLACVNDPANSTEEMQDAAGALFGGTETGISVTYDDANNDVDFVVSESDPRWQGNSTLVVYTSDTTSWDKDTSNDLTTSTSWGGDLSGTGGSPEVKDSSHLHDAANISAGNLAVARMPTGGSWSLSSDLNFDSNTLVVSYDDDRVGIGTTTPSNKLDVAGDINASSGSLIFYNEIMPDGATCSNGEILKKTGANDWDCAADSGLTTSYNATYHTTSLVVAGNYSNWANQTANDVQCADCVGAGDIDSSSLASECSTITGAADLCDGVDNTCSTAACTVGNDDTLTSPTVGGNLDMGNYLVQNIGNANTDFTSGGGLNLNGNLGITGTGTNTIAGHSNFDGNTLFVNATTHYVGIGTASPGAKLTIKGTGTQTQLSILDSSLSTEWDLGTNVGSGGSAHTFGIYSSEWGPSNGYLPLFQINGTSGYTYFSGNVGIGTTAPTSRLTVSLNAAPLQPLFSDTVAHFSQIDALATRLVVDSYGPAVASIISGRIANGTAANPSAIATDKAMLLMDAYGYGSTGYSATSRVGIRFMSAEQWTDTAQGTYIAFRTTPKLSAVAGGAEVMRITDSGNVGIGTTTANERLNVSGNVTISDTIKSSTGNVVIQLG